MGNKILDGFKMAFGFSLFFLIIGVVFAGWHPASSVVSGVFQGDYVFNGSVDFSSASVVGLDTGGTPSGAIMMFNSSCPVGWSEYVQMRSRFPMGEPTGNAGSLNTGGATSHSHSIPKSGYGVTEAAPTGTIAGAVAGVDFKDEGITSDPITSAVSHYPPYAEIIFCIKD